MEQLGGRSRVISRADSRACFNLQVGSSDAVTMQGDTHLPGNLHHLPELLNSCRGLEQLFPPPFVLAQPRDGLAHHVPLSGPERP
jgi:hypothetical protein